MAFYSLAHFEVFSFFKILHPLFFSYSQSTTYKYTYRQWLALCDVSQRYYEHVWPAIHFHCGVAAVGQRQAFFPRLAAVGATEIID